jgi:iron-sulfur cluster repair protein YtfE (RIC family)
MVKLSRYAVQETVRMNATERLKAWYDAVKNDITANNLGEKDIVDLFISSLGALPREKYKRVLSGVRQVRHIKIARQNDIIDVDAEVAKFKKELADRSVKERIATEFPDLNEPEYGKEITSPDCNDVALPDTEENLFGGITHGHGPKS